MEDEIFKIIAAEMAGEKVTEEERGKVERWRVEKEENERVYRMVVGELGEVVRLVKAKGGWDGEGAYMRLEEEMRRRIVERSGKRESGRGKARRMAWWRYGASVAGVLLMLGGGMMMWMKSGGDGEKVTEERIVPGSGQVMLTLGRGEVVPLKRDTNELIVADTALRIMNERNTLVYMKVESKGKAEDVVYNTLTVPVSGEYCLVLADGTKVFLNSGSEIRYPAMFRGKRREVFLKGEAWFEVAKDSTRGFWVHAGEMNVKVLGTSFNVKAYEKLGTVATTLVEGCVEIVCEGKNFRIVPGEQFVYDKDSRESDVREVDTELYTSWKDGYYKFRQAALEEIMTTLSVWYGLNVFYQNEDAKHIEFTGKVKRYEDVRNLLNKFEQTENVVFDIKGNNVVIRVK